jgi:predicted amidohydrolase YtcJ
LNSYGGKVSPMQKQAEMVLKNGVVYTVDSHRSQAEAVAVSGKDIIFVGSDAGASAHIGPDTELIDLKGKMVLPGFIDSHAHASTAFDERKTLNLHGLKSLTDYQAALRKFAARRPELEVIYGSGWDNSVFPPSGPSKVDLDGVVSDRPVSLHSNDGHSIWVNSRAIEAAGVTKETPDPKGGVIEKDPRTREPTGTFRENANDLIQNMLPPYSVAQVKDSIRIFAEEAARVGITTVHDPLLLFPDSGGILLGFGTARNNMIAYEQLAEKGDLTLRVRGSLLTDPTKGVSQVPKLAAACAEHTHPLFRVAGAKVFVDGVVEGGTAYLSSPYAHRTGFRGAPLWQQQELDTLFEAVDRENLQIHIHAIGDAAVRMAMDSLAFARRQNGQRDARHLITHLHVVDYGDIPRFAELGVIGVPQPFWHVKGDYFHDLEVKYLGRERAEKEYPMKSFLKAGVTLAAASDYPVQVPSPPLEGIQLGVTRCLPGETDPTEILGPDERMNLADMIAAFTINGAFANFLENETGSIEVGKKADLVVLEKNLFEIPASEIASTGVLMTLFEGQTVLRDAGL